MSVYIIFFDGFMLGNEAKPPGQQDPCLELSLFCRAPTVHRHHILPRKARGAKGPSRTSYLWEPPVLSALSHLVFFFHVIIIIV